MREYVKITTEKGIGTIEFYHPQSNSLPINILSKITSMITKAGEDKNIKVRRQITGFFNYKLHGLKLFGRNNLDVLDTLKEYINIIINFNFIVIWFVTSNYVNFKYFIYFFKAINERIKIRNF